jgi:hypothetical protein
MDIKTFLFRSALHAASSAHRGDVLRIEKQGVCHGARRPNGGAPDLPLPRFAPQSAQSLIAPAVRETLSTTHKNSADETT